MFPAVFGWLLYGGPSIPGLILEEAETKAGGPAKLQTAVEAGRVKKSSENGIDMYHFPRVLFGCLFVAGHVTICILSFVPSSLH